ncbi:uncharacterized protein OCT59_018315 [Rhizophagus irregularis]|uniref:Kelch-like protein 17 n=1 Tax=Rhizophagus irregularis (strain DAOM 197198w) TaxID=1432141 RepID=A0A015K6S0_RHIIW|nr:hypothetical protein RirG_154740 [Rhizophagus irregularis DAOM 197198w]UZO26067.1 hypothetical protein OCT59_018315 [Rhizophagus irregularis]GBC42050.1 hypothetical protein GLOIN_2v1782772 [Rhizophagus irregularis DAOM 181602=DAOM 197198]
MSTQFFSNLSRNYIEILEDSEYYDVTIEVGEDPNVKIFRAHMNILCHRSSYLRRALISNNKKNNNDGVLSHTKLPNILPEIFQIVLKYIYGGILSLDEENTSDILKVLVAADELILHELVDYLQTYLIKNKADWLEKHFELIHRTSFQSNNLLELQKFCTEFMAKSPDKIFESLDFTSLPEKSLVSLLKRDDLRMKEIEVWEHVLKWGLAQNPTLTPDPDTWTDDDFKTMENSLQYCLPLIRFYSLSSKDFLEKVRPYKKLLKHQLYEDLIKYYLDFESEPSNNFLPPRNGKFDSKIVNLNIISQISKWIDKVNSDCKLVYTRELYLPYEFKLLLRGSRDGFTPDKFHSLCDNKPKTVTFIKVNGTDEILGGYNPIIWETKYSHNYWCETKDSFIFSFKYKNGLFKDGILSNVKEMKYALNYGQYRGPSFGWDLYLYGNKNRDYDDIYCKQNYYEKKISDTEDNFSIEDYEVFQIIKL